MYFTHISMLSVRRFCLNKLTILAFSLFITSHIDAQIDIKSKVDAQTYTEYSKVIDLFEKNINQNDVVTLFIPINYSLDRLQQDKYDKIFVQNDVNEINAFIDNYSLNQNVDLDLLKQNLINSNSVFNVTSKSSKNYFFSINDNNYMISDNKTFEANVFKIVVINSNLSIYFIKSVIKY